MADLHPDPSQVNYALGDLLFGPETLPPEGGRLSEMNGTLAYLNESPDSVSVGDVIILTGPTAFDLMLYDGQGRIIGHTSYSSVPLCPAPAEARAKKELV